MIRTWSSLFSELFSPSYWPLNFPTPACVCVGNIRLVYVQGSRKAINLDVPDINCETETRDVVVSFYILSFRSVVYFSAIADTMAQQIGRVMVSRVLLKPPPAFIYLTDLRGNALKSTEVRDCPVIYYCFKYSSAGII